MSGDATANEALINANPDCQRTALLGFLNTRLGMNDGRPIEHPIETVAVLTKFDPPARVAPSGIAVRTYARRRAAADTQDLFIALERDLLPGYAWAFPTREGLWNIGVGVLDSQSSASKINLRDRLDRLLAGAGVLGARLGPMDAVEPYRGAPLRTGLTGSSLGRPGLAIVGEAVENGGAAQPQRTAVLSMYPTLHPLSQRAQNPSGRALRSAAPGGRCRRR